MKGISVAPGRELSDRRQMRIEMKAKDTLTRIANGALVAVSKSMDDLEAWGKLTQHLYVWDYSTNYRNMQYPMPIEHTFQPNLRAYANHVRMVLGDIQQRRQR